MTRVSPRTPLHSSQLVRVLSDLTGLKALPGGSVLAEGLGQWVDYTDAITLRALQNQPNFPAPELPVPRGADDPTAAQLMQALEQLERTQGALIRASTVPLPGADAPAISNARELSAAYEPCRRYCQNLQRDMQLAIAPLRNKVREILARKSAQLRQLATLDVAFENILRERESRLLGGIAALLMPRFAECVKAPASELSSAHLSALELFATEIQDALLAELSLRLQTTRGMIEALQQDPPTRP